MKQQRLLRRGLAPLSMSQVEAFRRSWRARGLWLGTVAWLVALAGILLIRDDAMRSSGVVLVLGAAALALGAWGHQRPPPVLAPTVQRAIALPIDRDRLLCLGGIALAGVIALVADRQFLAHPNETFGVAGRLWLLGMVSLVTAAAGWPQRREQADRSAYGPDRHAWVVEGSIIAGLTILALVLRVWDLTDIPYAIHPDEIMTGRVATEAYLSGAPQAPVFSTVWTGINLPALWFAAVAASLKLSGATLAGLRLPAALFGAATVIPFYGLLRLSWGRLTALAGGLLLAVSAVHVHFSRVTVNNIVTPFFWTLCFYFLVRGLSRRRPADWALAGIAAGLSEYGYYGTHLLPFVILGFGVYLAIVHRQTGLQAIGQFGLLALGYVAAFGPLLAYYTQHPDIYLGRGAGVLTWDHIPRSLGDLHLMWTTLWPLMQENLLGISTDTDQGSFYWAPLLLPTEAALLVLGTALLVRQWRHPPAFLMLLSGLGTLFVGGTLVHGVPFIQHWTPAFPAFYAAVALPLGAWGESAGGLCLPRNRSLATGGLALALAALALLDVVFYFHQYQATRPEFEIRAAQSRWETGLGRDYQVWVVGHTWQPYDRETNEYLLHGQVGGNLLDPAHELPLPPAPGKGLAFVFFPDNQQYEGMVRVIYPGGSLGEVRSHTGVHLFYTYVVPPALARSR